MTNKTESLIKEIEKINSSLNGRRAPSLKLFISFDLIGSTSFKHSKDSRIHFAEAWYVFFKKFYINNPISLLKSYTKLLSKEIDFDTIENQQDLENFTLPYLWKNLGDEIIYVADIEDTKHIVYHIEAMQKAIIHHNSYNDIILKVKGAAWIAHFPVINSVIFDEVSHKIEKSKVRICNNKHIDFIGPTIDLGFRISKYSSQRKLVLSTALTYMLVKELIKDKNCENIFSFYFDGMQETKGVRDGSYPIVWIDNYQGHTPKAEKLYGVKKERCELQLLYSFVGDQMFLSDKNTTFPFVYSEMVDSYLNKEYINGDVKKIFKKFCFLYVSMVPNLYKTTNITKSNKLTNSKSGGEKFKQLMSDMDKLKQNPPN